MSIFSNMMSIFSNIMSIFRNRTDQRGAVLPTLGPMSYDDVMSIFRNRMEHRGGPLCYYQSKCPNDQTYHGVRFDKKNKSAMPLLAV